MKGSIVLHQTTCTRRIRFLLFLWTFTTTVTDVTVATSSQYLNVYGKELQKCSTSGTALTGYTRTGYCVEQSDDTGSHHICINLNSTTGGNFCDVTGQSNWCSSTDMPCDDNGSGTGSGNGSGNNPEDEAQQQSATCAIENWCVCQWAFASYIKKAGGCDQIQDIQCSAINIEALYAYQSTQGYEQAYQCLVERCNLASSSSSYSYSTTTNALTKALRPDPTSTTTTISAGWKWLAVAGFVMAMVGTAYSTLRQQAHKNHHHSFYCHHFPSCTAATFGMASGSKNKKEDTLLSMDHGGDDDEAVVIR